LVSFDDADAVEVVETTATAAAVSAATSTATVIHRFLIPFPFR
jgi:hypothetical protein